jgi:hypothetical protein
VDLSHIIVRAFQRVRSAARLEAIKPMKDRVPQGGGMARVLTIDEIMTILPVTPARIASMTEGLTEARLRAAPEPDAWSVNDVLAHLRACHDVLGGNILRILAEDMPAWRRLSPRAWIRKTDYPAWAFAPAFEAFEAQRAELLAVLEPLPPDDWERIAKVTEPVGKTVDRSALYYGDWMAGHERAHWSQIGQIVAVVQERPRATA